MNSWICSRGLSSREIMFQWYQLFGKTLAIKDEILLSHAKNHDPSANSKGEHTKCIVVPVEVTTGSLVFFTNEGDKTCRELNIVTSINNNYVTLQKMNDTNLKSQSYEVPLTNIFPATITGDNCY